MSWDNSVDIESILENIRLNSLVLSKEHKKRYLLLKRTLKYYRIPVIIISAINSVVSIGSQPFLDQKYISIANCGMALLCGLIGSIELYYGIQSQMEKELMSSKDYYILSTNIFKTLSLNHENRPTDGKTFLDECYSIYIKLYQGSCVLHKNIKDKLTPIVDIPRTISTDGSDNSNQYV